MSQSYEFYSARADEAALRAKEATLENVRVRELRAEKSWRALADQARKTVVAREKADARRAAKREAEALAQQ
ncbi:hypothetical protein [Erythrobacter sp. THAF29]|uniref:hypothetical protein n=1 Tax=Erythrobacter sp. THAF29 TaxID=2587851 RepID=UPI0012695E31|nr:hypothetical protein [Erythrobacter sp. THAF29]QFT78803.1 hypothetical protein FIU90_14730 [Erythrobacter sp. THAF29]